MSVETISFGCRLNFAESETIARSARAGENWIVVNSCAVTNEAGQPVPGAQVALELEAREQAHVGFGRMLRQCQRVCLVVVAVHVADLQVHLVDRRLDRHRAADGDLSLQALPFLHPR